jgi:hypothetical protein
MIINYLFELLSLIGFDIESRIEASFPIYISYCQYFSCISVACDLSGFGGEPGKILDTVNFGAYISLFFSPELHFYCSLDISLLEISFHFADLYFDWDTCE